MGERGRGEEASKNTGEKGRTGVVRVLLIVDKGERNERSSPPAV